MVGLPCFCCCIIVRRILLCIRQETILQTILVSAFDLVGEFLEMILFHRLCCYCMLVELYRCCFRLYWHGWGHFLWSKDFSRRIIAFSNRPPTRSIHNSNFATTSFLNILTKTPVLRAWFVDDSGASRAQRYLVHYLDGVIVCDEVPLSGLENINFSKSKSNLDSCQFFNSNADLISAFTFRKWVKEGCRRE